MARAIRGKRKQYVIRCTGPYSENVFAGVAGTFLRGQDYSREELGGKLWEQLQHLIGTKSIDGLKVVSKEV